MIRTRQDLTGQKFGRLTVMGPVQDLIEKSGRHRPQWLCTCECGNSHIVTTQHLKSGNTKSCGCLNKELTARRNSDRFISNTYNLDSEYGIGYTYNNKEFYFSLEDYDKLSEYKWYIDNQGYVRTKISRKTLSMHRMLMTPSEDLVVDHINHNKTDNRRSNLRVVTQYENMQNKSNSKKNK